MLDVYRNEEGVSNEAGLCINVLVMAAVDGP